MIRELAFAAILASPLSAQQTEVAGGYHVAHGDGTARATGTSAAKAEKTAAKKTAAKKKHGIKPIVNGK